MASMSGSGDGGATSLAAHAPTGRSLTAVVASSVRLIPSAPLAAVCAHTAHISNSDSTHSARWSKPLNYCMVALLAVGGSIEMEMWMVGLVVSVEPWAS